MKNFADNLKFDQASGVKIQAGKLETVKKIIEAIENDLYSLEIDKYHRAAIAIQVLYDYFESGGKFHNECKDFLKKLINHSKETSETTAH